MGADGGGGGDGATGPSWDPPCPHLGRVHVEYGEFSRHHQDQAVTGSPGMLALPGQSRWTSEVV